MTKGTSFLSKLARRIHPPLLTTPRESEQLLRSLQTSFEKSLDRAHPSSRIHGSGPVDAHINAIVSDPLLRARQDHFLAPQDLFDREVAAGNATLDTAKACLRTYARYRAKTGATESSDGSAKFVRSLQRWLRSSGLDETMEFVHDENFVSAFLDSMTPRMASLASLKWYNKLSSITTARLDKPKEIRDEYVSPMALLFRRIVFDSAKVDGPFALQSLMAAFIGKYTVVSSELPSLMQRTIVKSVLVPLVDFILEDKTLPSFDIAVYDSFHETVKCLHWDNGMVTAALALKHPSRSSPEEALLILEKIFLENHWDFKPAQRARILKLAEHTAASLLTAGQDIKAHDMLDRLQTLLNGTHTMPAIVTGNSIQGPDSKSSTTGMGRAATSGHSIRHSRIQPFDLSEAIS